MRIDELHIDGFGHYHQRAFGPFAPGLTLVSGDNEAGKSTLSAFVRAILFGFPPRSGQHYPPLDGGEHGGRVAVTLADGSRYAVARYQGPRGVEIRDAAGNAVTEAQFAALIGHASSQYFMETFSFDLTGLHGIRESRQDDPDLARLLHGASLGAERIPQVEGGLDKRIGEIFTPRQRTRGTVVEVLDQLETTERDLSEVAGQAAAYGELSARLGRVTADLEAAGRHQGEREQGHRELDRQHRAWDGWNRLRALDARLAELGDTSGFPEQGVARLEALEEDVREGEQAARAAAGDLEQARGELAADVPDLALLDAAEAIDSLRRDRGAAAGWLRDLPVRERELEANEGELAQKLGALGPGWDEQRVLALDRSIPRRAELDGWRARLDDGRADLQDRAREVQEHERTVQDATTSLHDAGTLLQDLTDTPDDDAIRVRAEQLRSLRRAHAEHAQAQQRVADLDAQRGAASAPEADRRRSGLRPAAAARVALGGAAGGLLGWVTGAPLAVFGGAVAGIALVGLLTWLVLRGGSRVVGRPVDGLLTEARARLGPAEAALREAAAAALGESVARPSVEDIDAAEAALERSRPRAEQRRWAEERVRGAQSELARARERHAAAEARHGDALAAAAEVDAAWRGWLASAGLPGDLAPHTATALLDQVELTRAVAQSTRELRRRVADIQGGITVYRGRVETVARRVAIEGFAEDAAAVSAADQLMARFDAARERRQQREQAAARVEERERAHRRAVEELERARDAVADLLAAGGVEDAEAFRQRARLAAERATIVQERRDCDLGLRQIVGHDDEALRALDVALAGTTREDLAERRESVREAMEVAQQQRDELNALRGELNTELARLHDDRHASDLRARSAASRTQLEDAARQWSALTIARALLRHTRERYERERQPAVIQRAAAHFEALTGGRYVRLYQAIGEPTVRVEERTGATKTPAQLSRGAREQLYLALRLGAIEEAVERNEPLPVVVDDVMVNFDRTRARHAAEAFVRLAAHTQVIVFTCHAWIAELFTAVAGSLEIIDLDHVDFDTRAVVLPAPPAATPLRTERGSASDGDPQFVERLL